MNDVEKAYQECLDYLYSFVDYSLTRNLRYAEEKFDLGRMRTFMGRLGNPQEAYPVIHVAGTKGKGSTAAMVASALQAAGYRVGFYTSPHLEEFCERIQINRQLISHADLVRIVDQVKPVVAEIEQLTTFELTTAAAFLYFAEQKVDVAVIEVGLGGRLDATNVVKPVVSVITSLSLDHTKVLGDTLAKIAFEKAGIIKPGRPVVMAPQREEARLVVDRVAFERETKLVQVGRDILFTPHQHSLDGQSLLLWRKEEQERMDRYIETGSASGWAPAHLFIPLLGHHQLENAATAYATLQVLREEGFPITEEQIAAGFREVVWPGRFEILRRSPLVIVDSAHNRDSALKLRLALDDYLSGRPVVLVFGASEDKDIYGMFSELLPRVKQVIATESTHPRALNANDLVALAHQFGCLARAAVPIERALVTAMELASEECAVVVTGSLFVAAAARQIMHSQAGAPHPG